MLGIYIKMNILPDEIVSTIFRMSHEMSYSPTIDQIKSLRRSFDGYAQDDGFSFGQWAPDHITAFKIFMNR